MSEQPTGLWEITSHGGTRHIINLEAGQRMRLPAAGRQTAPGDGVWVGFVAAEPWPPTVDGTVTFHTLSEWWRTSAIAAVRQYDPDDLPDGNGVRATDE